MPETTPTEVPPAAAVEATKALSGLTSPVLTQTVLKIVLGVVAVAAAVIALPATAPELAASLPPVIFKIAQAIAALGTIAGLVSPGLRKPTEAATAEGKAAEAKPLDTLNK